MDERDEVSKLELDLLLLYYTFADQYGRVDITSAKMWARERLGVDIDSVPFTINQEHIDLLMDHGIIADTRDVIAKLQQPLRKDKDQNS